MVATWEPRGRQHFYKRVRQLVREPASCSTRSCVGLLASSLARGLPAFGSSLNSASTNFIVYYRFGTDFTIFLRLFKSPSVLEQLWSNPAAYSVRIDHSAGKSAETANTWLGPRKTVEYAGTQVNRRIPVKYVFLFCSTYPRRWRTLFQRQSLFAEVFLIPRGTCEERRKFEIDRRPQLSSSTQPSARSISVWNAEAAYSAVWTRE